MSSKSIKIGVIGTGMISQLAHIPCIIKTSNAELIAVADHKYDHATLVANKFGINKIYPSHKELIDESEIDAVLVAVRRNATEEIVEYALKNNKHVLSEKPMASSLERAKRLYEISKKNKLVYTIGYMKRYDTRVRELKFLLEKEKLKNELGELEFIIANNFCSEYIGRCDDYIKIKNNKKNINIGKYVPDWIPEKYQSSYSWFLNVGCHTFNIIRYLIGNNIHIENANIIHDTKASILLTNKEKLIQINMGKCATGEWDETISFFFEKGKINLRFTSFMQRYQSSEFEIISSNKGSVSTRYLNNNTWSFELQTREFINAIHNNESTISSAEDSLLDMGLIENAWRMGLFGKC